LNGRHDTRLSGISRIAGKVPPFSRSQSHDALVMHGCLYIALCAHLLFAYASKIRPRLLGQLVGRFRYPGKLVDRGAPHRVVAALDAAGKLARSSMTPGQAHNRVIENGCRDAKIATSALYCRRRACDPRTACCIGTASVPCGYAALRRGNFSYEP